MASRNIISHTTQRYIQIVSSAFARKDVEDNDESMVSMW